MDDKDREMQRLERALKRIRTGTEAGLRLSSPEARLKMLRIIRDKVDEALNPPSDDEILERWDNAKISEGVASEHLGVSRVEAREMLHEWQARQCANNGHEWRELSSHRMVCVRCQVVKAWDLGLRE